MGALSDLCFWRFVPLAGFFILITELCERFCYYGMVAILPTFLTSYLSFTQSSAVQTMSGISFSSYAFAFLGAILSDSYLGRFLTIGIFCGIYTVGVGALSLSAYPGLTGVPPHWWLTGLALLIIALGTGGIKPCVSSFGGDQIESAVNRARFFSYFYLMVNVGSFASMYLTPLIRSQHCNGREDCYTWAFALPGILMFLATVIFLAGYKMYRKPPRPNSIMSKFFGACASALKNRIVAIFRGPKDQVKPESWLFYASDRYSMTLLKDCRAMLKVLTTFLPMCLYWGLYSQMTSRWVFQATMMTGKVGKMNILPEQMGMVNCILVLVFVPLFDGFLYPLLGKILRRPITPYAKILIAMVLGSFSFVIAAFLQISMEARGTFQADPLNPESLKCISGCTSMFWQIPQYVILTASEVFLATANLALTYAMAPAELKSLCSAMGMLTNAAGNLLVMGMARLDPVSWFTKGHAATGNFFMWAGLCLVGMVWFIATTWNTVFPEDQDAEPVKLEAIEVVEVPEAEKKAAEVKNYS